MSDFLNIADFLSPISKAELNFDTGYKEGTIGHIIQVHDDENFPDIDEADLVFIGCGEQRGNGHHLAYSAGPDAIRRQFYQLFFWHQDLRLADLGVNTLPGRTAPGRRGYPARLDSILPACT